MQTTTSYTRLDPKAQHGLLARIAKDPKSEREISDAKTAEDFIDTLARLEAKL